MGDFFFRQKCFCLDFFSYICKVIEVYDETSGDIQSGTIDGAD